jgi:hypothetical protein
MKPTLILALAAILLACNAFAGFYATAAFAAVMSAGIADPDCRPGNPVTLAGCNEYPPEDRR